ncbi:DgyrCDS2779 [Dimorphilus gyrociliatus]|uniref:DgyrCDS2779 n=1 Tax=Dimorphilus gyrociliatus TaxID=2664684 RepID=A0A7I8VBA3_9ANNE|nr:DgyrCDS2779 [Dimorphilus gyrociliatus]
MRRVPYASVVAFAMCVSGAVICCVCLYAAFSYIVMKFEVDMVKKIVWLVMFMHIGAAGWFLFLAILFTGHTRKEACARCGDSMGFFAKCQHVLAILSAYGLHLLWLILPAILLIPVVIVTVFVVVCGMIPDCFNLSDYGIKPEHMEKFNPASVIGAIKSFDPAHVETAVKEASKAVEKTLTEVEKSGVLDKLITQFEGMLPSEEELDKLVDDVQDAIDTEQWQAMVSEVGDKFVGMANSTLKQWDESRNPLGNRRRRDFDSYREETLQEYKDSLTDNYRDMLSRGEAKVIELSDNTFKLVRTSDGEILHMSDHYLKTAEDFANEKAEKIKYYRDTLSEEIKELIKDGAAIIYPTEGGTIKVLNTKTNEIIDESEKLFQTVEEFQEEQLREYRRLLPENLKKFVLDGKAKIVSLADGSLQVVNTESQEILHKSKSFLKTAEEFAKEKAEELKDFRNSLSKDLKDLLADGKAEIETMKDGSLKLIHKTTKEILKKSQHILKTALQFAEEAKENIEKEVKNSVEKMKEYQDAVRKALEDAPKNIQEMIKRGEAQIVPLKNATLAIIKKGSKEVLYQTKKLLKTAEEFAKDKVEQVKKIAEDMRDKAKETAELAKKKAEEAWKKAKEAANALRMEVDEKAKELAKTAEKEARIAAQKATEFADTAFKKAAELAGKADEIIERAMREGVKWARQALKDSRKLATSFLRGARNAAREVGRNAKQVANVVARAKDEIVNVYETFLMLAQHFGIRQDGNNTNTYCSDAKVFFCAKLKSAQVNLIAAFIASVLINLSMVHFLMCMGANWVRIKREKEEKTPEFVEDLPEKMKLNDFQLSRTGSFVHVYNNSSHA